MARHLELLRQHAREAREVEAFEERLTSILAQESPQRRSMLLDSLQVQVANAVKQAKAWAALTVEATELLTSIAEIDRSELAPVRAELGAAVASGDSQRLASQIEACRRMVEAETRANAARARRNAVLQGLASLGYRCHPKPEPSVPCIWSLNSSMILATSVSLRPPNRSIKSSR